MYIFVILFHISPEALIYLFILFLCGYAGAKADMLKSTGRLLDSVVSFTYAGPWIESRLSSLAGAFSG